MVIHTAHAVPDCVGRILSAIVRSYKGDCKVSFLLGKTQKQNVLDGNLFLRLRINIHNYNVNTDGTLGH